MMNRAEIPPSLNDSALKTHQVAFLLFVIYVVTVMLGVTWGRSADPGIRFAWQNLLIHAMAAPCFIALVVAVPQLRRSLPFLYSRPRASLSAGDALAFLGVMIAWGLGAHRLFVLYPVISWYPASTAVLNGVPGTVSVTFMLIWSLTTGVLAPFTEELVFRGILLNLWRRRWGAGRAVLFSSIAFGTFHFQYAVFATVAGIFLALVYLKYRSLWPGTLLHSLYNLVAGPLYFGRMALDKNAAASASPGEWLPEIALTLAFFPLLYLFWRRFRPAN
jgi:membrane protease YdiL (CAAX protease family)